MAPLALVAPLAPLAPLAPTHYPDLCPSCLRSNPSAVESRRAWWGANRSCRSSSPRSTPAVSAPFRQAAERPDGARARSTREVHRRDAVVGRDPVDAPGDVRIVSRHSRNAGATAHSRGGARSPRPCRLSYVVRAGRRVQRSTPIRHDGTRACRNAVAASRPEQARPGAVVRRLRWRGARARLSSQENVAQGRAPRSARGRRPRQHLRERSTARRSFVAVSTRIDPRDPSGAPRDAAHRLASAIKQVLQKAIARQSKPAYRDDRFLVYDREGERCSTPGCKGVIHRRVQSGRSTFLCPVCQR